MFESSSHPHYTPDRANAALTLLDEIIGVLGLCGLDRGDPGVTTFRRGQVPKTRMPDDYRPPLKCSCITSDTSLPDLSSMSFTYNPPWDPNWSDEEIRDEECRRVCWGALTLYANHSAQCMAFNENPLCLKLSEPSNVST